MDQLARRCIFDGDRGLAGRRVGVLGLARTGAAAVEFLADAGAAVTAMDSRPAEEFPQSTREVLARAQHVFAPYDNSSPVGPLDLLVVSPGVPTEAPIVRRIADAGARIIGEVELAYRSFDAPVAAVTGTCGKGTTVTTLGALLTAGGLRNVVAGNIGTPLIGYAHKSAELDVIVAEVSSFQLETTVHFRPHIAALLNITEDHLERYASFDDYVAAKLRVFANQSEQDWAILCADDPVVRGLLSAPRSRVLTVSLSDPAANARTEAGALVVQLPGEAAERVATREDIVLPGDHHVLNALTACLAARLCGVPAEAMPEAIRGYTAADHLMTVVGRHSGVTYIDDSKATNPASAIADLQSIEGPVIVIAGGKEKDTDFADFGQALRDRAKRVLLIGECAGRIARSVGSPELCTFVSSMDEAVSVAVQCAQPGDTVALCPGCSSLDMFQSYAARGDEFARSVTQHTSRQREG